MISSQFSDLAHDQADVAIRPDMDPGDNLVGHRIGVMKHAFYASDEYIKKKGSPSDKPDLSNHPVCGYGFELKDYSVAKWENKNILPESIIARFGTTTALTQAVIEGLGIGLLPCFVGDSKPELSPVFIVAGGLPVDIWLVSTVASRRRPKVRAFFDYFTHLMKADSAKFTGHSL